MDFETLYQINEGKQFMEEVVRTNASRRAANPAYRSVDPNQPALSPEAEVVRQAKAVDKSNFNQFMEAPAYEPLSISELEKLYDQALAQEKAPVAPALVTRPEAELNPKGFTPTPLTLEQRLKSNAQAMGESSLARTIEPVVKSVPGLETGLNYLAAPGDYLRGLLIGEPGERVDPYTFGGVDPSMSHGQAAVRGAFGMMVDPLLLLGAGAGVLRGTRAVPKGPSIPPVSPSGSPIPGGIIDELAAAQGITPRATGTPDYPAPGPRTEETGRTLAVPSLEVGGKTDTLTGISARTGKPLKQSVPGLSPGEYGPEPLVADLWGDAPQQTQLIPDPSTIAPTPGKRIVEPGEQFGVGEVPLRPQVYRKPGLPQPEVIPNPLSTPTRGIDPSKIEYPGLGPSVKEGNIPPFSEKFLRETIQKKERIINNYHAPQQDYRLTLQTSPRGSASVIEAERDSGLSLRRTSEAPSDTPLVFVGWPSRISQDTLSTLKQMGPPGRNIASAIDAILSNRAVLSTNDVINTVTQLEQIAGKRGMASKVIEGFRELTKGENAFIWGTHRYFNLTESEIEQIWNYMYTEGRMVPSSTKARAFADKLYEGMLYGPSNAAHEVGLEGYNPLTGKHFPFGSPSLFMPQIPEKPSSLAGVSKTHLELLYKKQGGFEGTGRSFPLWESQLRRVLARGGELREMKAAEAGASKLGMDEAAVTYDMAVKKYKGMEIARLFDLEVLGGSPYQWAKKFGIGTDPFRNAFRYNSSGYLRTEWARHMPQIEQNMAQLAEHGGTDLVEWAKKAVERSQGIHTEIGETSILRNLVKGVRDFHNVSLLQLGGIGSTPQLGYALGRAPLGKSFLGAVDFVTGKNRELVDKSAALFPTLMNHMMQPEGPLAMVSTAAHRTYGVTLLDKWSRSFGGHVATHYLNWLEQGIAKYPNKERLHKLIDEIGGDSREVLRLGYIPEKMKLAMIQRYANYVAGIPDVRGLPLIATNETAHWRLANQYRIFMFNNQAELVRLWKEAPTLHDAIGRISKVLLGTGTLAAGSGALTEAIRNAFVDDKEGSQFVNKRLKKIVGDEGSAFFIQTLIYGLGALYGSLILTGLDEGWKLAAQLSLGPTAGLIAGTAEDVFDAVTNGPNWKTLRTTARRIPLVGPLLAPIVQQEAAEDAKRRQRKEQFRKSFLPEGLKNDTY